MDVGKVLVQINMWPELCRGLRYRGRLCAEWLCQKWVAGGRCVESIMEEGWGTIKKGMCDSRTVWRGQYGIEVRVMSVTVISIVIGGGRWCCGLLCVASVWRTAVARVVCRGVWFRELQWGENWCEERDGWCLSVDWVDASANGSCSWGTEDIGAAWLGSTILLWYVWNCKATDGEEDKGKDGGCYVSGE